MANFRKSFSFRNGVQVDDDNLIVNSNGLVGIGTSIPTELLDVRGTAKVVGLVTANRVFAQTFLSSGIATFSSITDGVFLLRAGIISSTTGIVTFYGDGRGLINIPTSQWVDVDVGLGYTSIYAAGNVGIATTNPRYTLQIGANPDSENGVGFNSVGSIKASGIITASTFSGNSIGVHTGSVIGNVTGNVNSTGLSTFTSVSVVGTITATTFSGNLIGNVTGNVNSTGISTFTTLNVGTAVTISGGIVTATSFVGSFVGPLTGIAQSASSLTGTPNIIVGVVTAGKVIADSIEVPNTGITTVSKLLHVGTGGTAFSALEGGRIGVGTALPTSEIQVRKRPATLVEVISETNQARISIGQSVGVGRSTAVLRFGNTLKTFDILNNDTGNINMYLHAGPAGVGTGRFSWIYGQTNNEIASLTYDGKFGIGITNPSSTLHIVGTSTVTGNAFFGGDVTISGNLVANINFPPVLNNTNLNNNTGVTTVANLYVSPTGIGSIGIGTNRATVGLDARTSVGLFSQIGISTAKFYTDEALNVFGTAIVGGVGIGTTTLYINPNESTFTVIQIHNNSVDLYGSTLQVKNNSAVAFSTDFARSIMDFGRVSTATTNPYIILPNVPTATITGLGNTIEGAIIYNSTTKKHQGYGSTNGGVTFRWIDLY